MMTETGWKKQIIFAFWWDVLIKILLEYVSSSTLVNLEKKQDKT